MKIFICKNKCFFLILCKNITGLGTGISGAVQNEQSIQRLCSCTFVVYTNGNAHKKLIDNAFAKAVDAAV